MGAVLGSILVRGKHDAPNIDPERPTSVVFLICPRKANQGAYLVRKPMINPLDDLRRQAKTLQKSYKRDERAAIERVELVRLRRAGPLKRADFLHVIARERNFASWPSLKTSVELRGMDQAAKLQRLKIALAHGQAQVAR